MNSYLQHIYPSVHFLSCCQPFCSEPLSRACTHTCAFPSNLLSLTHPVVRSLTHALPTPNGMPSSESGCGSRTNPHIYTHHTHAHNARIHTHTPCTRHAHTHTHTIRTHTHTHTLWVSPCAQQGKADKQQGSSSSSSILVCHSPCFDVGLPFLSCFFYGGRTRKMLWHGTPHTKKAVARYAKPRPTVNYVETKVLPHRWAERPARCR